MISCASDLIALIDQMHEQDQVKSLVDHTDFLFRSGAVKFSESDWPIISAAVAKWKSENRWPISPKRCWRVIFTNGKACTMIIEIECGFDEALMHAKHRFFEMVLTVT